MAKYWVGGTGTWNTSSHWSASSGGGGGDGVPGTTDDVFFDSASYNDNYTVNIWAYAYCKSITISKPTGTGKIVTIQDNGQVLNVYGSLSMTGTAEVSLTTPVFFLSTTTGNTITTNGNSLSLVNFNGVGGYWTLSDNFSVSNSLTLTKGTFDAGNKNITCYTFVSSGTDTRSLKMGSGTWNITNASGGDNCWDLTTVTGLTFDSGTSTIKFTGSLLNPGANFYGGGLTYYNFWNATSGGYNLTIFNNNTFNNIRTGSLSRTVFGQTVNTTMTSMSADGVNGALAYIRGNGGTATITKAGGGVVSLNYMSVWYLTGSPDTTWYMGTNSTDVGNNSKIYFTAPPNLTNLKTWNGLAKASVKKFEGLAIASTKTWNSLT